MSGLLALRMSTFTRPHNCSYTGMLSYLYTDDPNPHLQPPSVALFVLLGNTYNLRSYSPIPLPPAPSVTIGVRVPSMPSSVAL